MLNFHRSASSPPDNDRSSGQQAEGNSSPEEVPPKLAQSEAALTEARTRSFQFEADFREAS